ncbi:MAG: BamA/TamA family outer membrane protein [Pseudomonadota bacterium]
MLHAAKYACLGAMALACAALPAYADAGLTLSVRVDGVDDEALRKTLLAETRLKDARPETTSAARRQARAEAGRMEKVLRASGRYDGQVDVGIDAGATPVAVVFDVTPGPVYRITDYRISYVSTQTPDARPARFSDIDVTADGAPDGETLAALERALLAALRRKGYPTARAVDRRAEARRDTATATAVFVIDSGPMAIFDGAEWSGLQYTKESYAASYTQWEDGAPVDVVKLEATRAALAGAGLFTSVQITPGAPSADGGTPILIDVEERKRRTVGAGLSYSSNLGAGGRLYWENRNLRGAGEKLRSDLDVSEIEQSLSMQYRKPRPRRSADWVLGAELASEDSEAFQGERLTLAAAEEKRYNDDWSSRIGLEIEGARTEDALSEETSALLSLPARLTWDATNDPLNPVRGASVAVSAAPHIGGGSDGFVAFGLVQAEAVGHYALNTNETLVAAGWARTGVTIGPGTTEIPATKRYYSGGGGSVRAYGFQLASPLDDDNDPIGGRSLFEAGAELRFPIRGALGGVVFAEGGSAFSSGAPDFDEPFLGGGGAGLRYYTPIGPVRLDIAAPFDRREGVDDEFQFYISLGQAF